MTAAGYPPSRKSHPICFPPHGRWGQSAYLLFFDGYRKPRQKFPIYCNLQVDVAISVAYLDFQI